MSEQKALIKKTKLGFFQRIRKALLIKNINVTKYHRAPEYLKNDNEVVDALIFPHIHEDLFEELTSSVPFEQQTRFLKDHWRDCGNLHEKFLLTILQKSPELVQLFSNEDFLLKVRNSVFSEKYMEYIKELPESRQTELLTKVHGIQNPKYIFYEKLDKFAPEAVLKLVKSVQDDDKKAIKIDNLPVELQHEITSTDCKLFFKKMSDEAKKDYKINPMELLEMSPETFKVYVKIHPEFTKLKDHWYISEKDQVTPDFLKKLIIQNARLTRPKENMLNYAIKWEDFYEVVRFDPELFLEKLRKEESRAEHFIRYLSLHSAPEISNALDCFQERYIASDIMLCSLTKVLLNKKVIEQCPTNDIVEFISKLPSLKIESTEANELFKNIIIKTHGERVKHIFDDRPMLTMDMIDNIDIFDPIVEEKFGKGVIHNLLSYDCNASKIIGELVRFPEKMKRFEMFDKAIGEYYNKSFLDLESKLSDFIELDDLLKNIKQEELTTNRCEKLKVIITDIHARRSFFYGMPNELSFIPLNSLDDLDRIYCKKK